MLGKIFLLVYTLNLLALMMADGGQEAKDDCNILPLLFLMENGGAYSYPILWALAIAGVFGIILPTL